MHLFQIEPVFAACGARWKTVIFVICGSYLDQAAASHGGPPWDWKCHATVAIVGSLKKTVHREIRGRREERLPRGVVHPWTNRHVRNERSVPQINQGKQSDWQIVGLDVQINATI